MGLPTGGVSSVHPKFRLVGIRSLALRRKLLLAVHAFAAGDLEGGNDTVTVLQVLHRGAH